MIDGLEYHIGLANLTETEAKATTYTDRLLAKGDRFDFINEDDHYFPSACYWDDDGTFHIRRLIA